MVFISEKGRDMASREVRRQREKIKSERIDEVEKKRNKQPVMWIFSVILLVIIIVTFVGVPTVSKMGYGSSSRLIFGTYAGKPIEYYPGNYFAQQRESIAEKMKDSITEENYQWQLYQLWRQAYENTVIHTALIDIAEESDVYITSERVDTAIAKYGPYTQNGEFDESSYLAASNTEKVSTRTLFEGNLYHEQVVQDLLFSLKTSSAEKQFVIGMASPERSFKYISFPFSTFPDLEYTAFGAENARLFTRMKLSRITIRTGEKDAKAIFAQISADPSIFEESARSHSQDGFAEKGGEMGVREYRELQEDFENTADLDSVFALKRGEVAGPFETSFGFTIYRCDEEASAPDFTDPDVISSVKSYMNRYERGRIEDYLTGVASGFIASIGGNSESFAVKAASAGYSVVETPYFPINYGNQFFFKSVQGTDSSNEIEGAADSETILTALFSLAPGAVSEPLLVDDAVIVAVLRDERATPAEELTTLELYYQYIIQQFHEEFLTGQILKSDLFKDNFMEIFAKAFLNSQGD